MSLILRAYQYIVPNYRERSTMGMIYLFTVFMSLGIGWYGCFICLLICDFLFCLTNVFATV